MATTSDGDPPDPSTAPVTTNVPSPVTHVQSPVTPAVHGAKNDTVSPTIDGEKQYFVMVDDDADASNAPPPLHVLPPPPALPPTDNIGTNTSYTVPVCLSSSSSTNTLPNTTAIGVSNDCNSDRDRSTIDLVSPRPTAMNWDNTPWSVVANRKSKRTDAPTATSHPHPAADADTLMTDHDNTATTSDNTTGTTMKARPTTTWTPIKIG